MRQYPLGKHGLSKVLLGLFLASWLGQLVSQYFDEANEAAQHGEKLAFWSQEFWWSFAQATLENFQSEFLQILTFVLLTVHLIHEGSHESRDGEDEMKEQLDRIEAQLQSLREGR